jgi:dihydroxy-acid dehydratase
VLVPGGMYTANTMSSAIEALGMSLPYSSNPVLSQEKKNKNALMLVKQLKSY